MKIRFDFKYKTSYIDFNRLRMRVAHLRRIAIQFSFGLHFIGTIGVDGKIIRLFMFDSLHNSLDSRCNFVTKPETIRNPVPRTTSF